jgi:outer membrane biosynthesis protein TonB
VSPAAAAAARRATARTATARAATARATRTGTAPSPRRAPARPSLRVVTPVPSRAPRAPFVLFSMLLVGLGLVGLLVLNTVVAQDAFTLHDLDRNAASLAEREQRLRQEVAALEAPAAVADRAHKLGLVPAGDPVFLTADGRVLGNPAPAAVPAAPTPAPPPAPRPTTAAKPVATAKPAPRPSAAPTPNATTARKPAPSHPTPRPSATVAP